MVRNLSAEYIYIYISATDSQKGGRANALTSRREEVGKGGDSLG